MSGYGVLPDERLQTTHDGSFRSIRGTVLATGGEAPGIRGARASSS